MSKKLLLLPLAVGMMAMSPLVVGEEPAQQQVKQQEQIYRLPVDDAGRACGLPCQNARGKNPGRA